MLVASDGLVDDAAPFVDDDGLLRFRGRWVALTDMQVPVTHLLIANVGRMVSIGEVRTAYAMAGGSVDRAALRSLMHRIGQRVTRVGASVTYASQRAGMMLTIPAVDAGAAS